MLQPGIHFSSAPSTYNFFIIERSEKCTSCRFQEEKKNSHIHVGVKTRSVSPSKRITSNFVVSGAWCWVEFKFTSFSCFDSLSVFFPPSTCMEHRSEQDNSKRRHTHRVECQSFRNQSEFSLTTLFIPQLWLIKFDIGILATTIGEGEKICFAN